MNTITIYSKISRDHLMMKIRNSHKLFLIEFGAAWCGTCQIMEPIINDLLTMYHDQLELVRVDIEQNQYVAEEYGIGIIPSYIFIRDGLVVDYIFHSASKSVFENIIKSQLSVKSKINV